MDIFWNFAYISNYLHLKSFAWKQDCPISSKLQTSRIWQRSFKKAFIEFYKSIENTKTIRLLFKGSWILPYFWHSNWHYFGYISGKVAKTHFLESSEKSLKTSQHSYQLGHPLQNNGPLKIWKFVLYLLAPFSKKRKRNVC